MKLGEGAGRQSGTGGVKDVKVCCTVGELVFFKRIKTRLKSSQTAVERNIHEVNFITFSFISY